MGYIKFLAACTVIVFAAACVKEETSDPEEVTGAYEEIVVSASTGTKTTMVTDDQESNKVEWCQGDDISAFSANVDGGGNCKLSSSHTEQTYYTTFKGVIEAGTTGVVVLYPYDASATYSQSDKVLTTTIPTEQTATVSSFGNGAAITVAQGPKVSREVSLEFKHLCSVLEFTIPAGISASQIKIESKNAEVKMTGAVTVDCSTAGQEAVTSAASSYVILNGTFESGKSYCVTVAPGNYDQGFQFTILTTKGNEYHRVAKPLETKAGCLYKLGTPSYEFDESNVTVEANIVPTYADMAVTGSTATLKVTTNLPEEFAGLVTDWTLQNVVFSQNGEEFRKTTSTALTSGTPVEVAATAGHPYMPHSVGGGKYTYTADICYKVNGKDHKLTINGEAVAPALDPDLFEIKFNFDGYTTFSVSKGYDGQTKDIARANSLDNETVWAVGGKTYVSGLSADVYAQCADPLLVYSATKYDGTTVSGTNVSYTKQSWAAHKISCDASFDGVSPTKQPYKLVHVTGLPYQAAPPKNSGSHAWDDQNGSNEWENGYVALKSAVLNPRIVSPTFYIPENIDVYAGGSFERNKFSIVNKKLYISLWNNSDPSQGNRDHKITLDSGDSWSGSVEDTMETDNFQKWQLQYYHAALGPVTYVYSFYVIYR